MLLQIQDPGGVETSPQGVVLGIDLGTTHSVVSLVKDGKPHVLDLGEGALVPSILSYKEEQWQVGRTSGEVLSSTKRFMGRDVTPLQCGEQRLTAVEAASHILSHLKQKAEQQLCQSIDGAVITVPAYFDEAARIATKQAAALADLKVLRLINEPTAAALAYGLEKGVQGVYAIYDFGGGTFDLSLLNLEDQVFQVLATGGDLELGGDDIDRALKDHCQLKCLKEACLLKERLSRETSCEGVTQQQLENIALPFVNKTLDITARVFEDAGFSPQEIKGVVLVGGMTRMPLVRRKVEAFFRKTPLHDVDPDQVVAMGAALAAHGLRYGSETLLLDVTPLSLGLETMGGLVEKIIPRNTPLPALASQEFTTYQDGQGGMVIHVVQGEREFTQDCRSLAQFELKGLPSLPAGSARVRVDFAVDCEGLLTVSALEKTTGLSQQIEVRPSAGLDENTLSQMILESQKHGKEDMEKRLEAEKKLSSRHPLFKESEMC